MESFPARPNAPKMEETPDEILKEVNLELRGIISSTAAFAAENKAAQRKSLFDRMSKGPEITTEDPEVAPLFEQVAAIEEKYGREAVADMAKFYVA